MVKSLHNHDSLEDFFAAGTTLRYEKGATIIHQEDDPGGVFFITEGFVKSFDITKYGEENLLVIRERGQMFPLLWTMANERTDVFYQAMSDVTLQRVDRESYLKRLDEDPKFVKEILEQVLTMYRIHSQRVLNLEYRSASERIAYRLLALADRFGEKTDKGIEIKAPIRHIDIASSVNCSRETASREISKLEKKDWVCSENGNLVLCDTTKIAAIVGQNDKTHKTFRFH